MKYFIYISCLFINSFLTATVCLDNISEKPVFQDISSYVPMGSDELYKIIAPLIKEHLSATNGDRLSILTQYLCHHDLLSSQDPNIDPLETLAAFSPTLSLSNLHGSYCFGLNEDLLSRLPPNIHAYTVPATLFPSTQQPYWPILSHVAIVIPFCNPNDAEDAGYILLDPHLKMDTPLVALFSGNLQQKNLKEKGICTLFYQDGKITSQSNLSTEENNFSMVYYIKEFINSVKVGLRPILAADRRMLLFSRTEEGRVIAYISLLFDNNVIRYYLEGNPKQEISFSKFLSHETTLSQDLIQGLHVDETVLLSTIEKILLHKNLLDDLYEKYVHLLEASDRSSEFHLPASQP